jgi:hypothetical protein
MKALGNWKGFRFPLTSIAVVVAAGVVGAALFGNINVLAFPFRLFAGIEENEIDEIIVALLLIALAVGADRVRARRRAEKEAIVKLSAERLRVVHITMRTVQDIVNNFLNQLQLLRLDADPNQQVESDTFDQALRETAAQLKALGDLEMYSEKQMAMGTALRLG